MKITLNNTVLAGGGSEGASGFTIRQVRAIQTVDLVRSPYGKQFPRGNIRHEVSFRVTRIHDSLRTALQFAAEHAQNVPTSGVLSWALADGGIRRWAKDAVPIAVDLVAQVGLTTVWSYTLVIGEILTKDPSRNPTAGS